MSGGAPKLGDKLVLRRGPVTTKQLVMYAGASGDFNRIHYDHPFAVEAGLGGVIVHGMLTMAFAGSCVTEAFSDLGWVSGIEARFLSPVKVGDVVDVTAVVVEADPGAPVKVTLDATVDGQAVLRGKAEITPIGKDATLPMELVE